MESVAWRNTSGPAAALAITIKDGVGATLIAGCRDVAYIEVCCSHQCARVDG